MESKLSKTLIPILNKLKSIIIVLGVILFLGLIYEMGELHGKVNTSFTVTCYKDVCDRVGYYNNNTKQCLIDCNDESVYSFNIQNAKFCTKEKPKFKDKLFIIMLSGHYLKEKDIQIYVNEARYIK